MSDEHGAGDAPSLALEDWHRERGARFETRRGLRLPVAYGDAAGERQALRDGCGLVDRSDIGRLELVGEDRRRFLNGLLTVDVAKLEAGGGVHGFATGPKGQVLAEVVVHALPDRLWLELPAGVEDGLRLHLQKYVVADRVEVRSLQDMLPLLLVGAGSEAVLTGAGVAAPAAPWGNVRAALFDTQVQVSRHERMGAPAFTVWTAAAVAETVLDRLVAELAAVPAGDDAVEAVRIEAGIARWGIDFGADTLPQEVGIEDAVDYRKGCYLGQEVVARLHYRGQAPRLLRSLALPRHPAAAPGLEVRFEGRSAGRLTSVTEAGRGDRCMGLAVLQRRACEPGTRVELEDGTPAVVCVPGSAANVAVPWPAA